MLSFYYKNKFEKLVHLVDFIIRIYHDARPPERQIVRAIKRSSIKPAESLAFIGGNEKCHQKPEERKE